MKKTKKLHVKNIYINTYMQTNRVVNSVVNSIFVAVILLPNKVKVSSTDVSKPTK